MSKDYSLKALMEEFPLNQGELVTVTEQQARIDRYIEVDGEQTVAEYKSAGPDYVGEIFQIKLIEGPFIVAERKTKYDHSNGDIVNLDMRLTKFRKVSAKYVELLTKPKV